MAAFSMLPRHREKDSKTTGRSRKLLSLRVLMPFAVLAYIFFHRSTKHSPIPHLENSLHAFHLTKHSAARGEPAFKATNGHTSERAALSGPTDDDGDDAEDAFLMAPRRPLDWAPDLQRLIEDGEMYRQNAKQRCLEGKTRPDWITSPQWSLAFPDYAHYAALVRDADTLPDLIMIPFEEAVAGDKLQGWEYQWVSEGVYDAARWGMLEEPRIDFVYTWVNGSDAAFRQTKLPYEWNSTLNDAEGLWRARHGTTRYRDWNEFRFSLRSLESHAPFRNKVQVLVNSVMDMEAGEPVRQEPLWLSKEAKASESIMVLAQEDFFEEGMRGCLPSFNSLTIENQIHNTESDVDRVFALSDDMLLGKPHSASDIYSPLFGHMIGFKTNSYNTIHQPTDADAQRFGEKPWLIYTSWLLNRRFGARKRKGMAHFGHSLSRKVMRETMRSFPRPELQSACSRFRGDFGFQLYSWYATFHYTIERHREVLLWSYLMVRSDVDSDGQLSWDERQTVLAEIESGKGNESRSSFRARNFYLLPDLLEDAGLEPPNVNFDILWTSLDGPVTIKDIDCFDFNANECLAPGFTMPSSDAGLRHPMFSTAAIFDRVSRQQPECGDCLIKILLHQVQRGLSPLLPHSAKQSREYDIVIKALMRYQYVVHDPDGLFVMVTDTEQVESALIKRFQKPEKRVGQLCLNDDVETEDEAELDELAMTLDRMYTQLFPDASSFEREVR